MATVITDPFDHNAVGFFPLKLKGDIVTCSHAAPGHNYLAGVKGEPYVIACPGEFEIGGVFITGVQTNGVHKKASENGLVRNTLFLIQYEGLNVVHLGDMDRVPSQAQVESLGDVHVLMVPVGGGTGLNAAKAAETISLLEPHIVVPMHYGVPECKLELEPLSKFLKAMGLKDVETVPSLKIANARTLPEETQVVVLDYKS
jgi:L-ascorbate metabolism protein UlaG (beta-lactamase superfamily)